MDNEVVKALSAFLDACYLARRTDITETTLTAFKSTLNKFYSHREIFRQSGICPDGFSLPCQHPLSHYPHQIQDFGAPGGVCSSITESRHITTVKKPWRRSNHYEALGQMLLTNQCLDKLLAACYDFPCFLRYISFHADILIYLCVPFFVLVDSFIFAFSTALRSCIASTTALRSSIALD